MSTVDTGCERVVLKQEPQMVHTHRKPTTLRPKLCTCARLQLKKKWLPGGAGCVDSVALTRADFKCWIQWGKSATTFTLEGKGTETARVKKSPVPSTLGTIWSSEDRKLSKRLTQDRFFRQTLVVTSSQAWELARAEVGAATGKVQKKETTFLWA